MPLTLTDFQLQSLVTMAAARQGEVSIHVEDPGPLTVLQVLGMTVEQLRYELQARNLTPLGTAKPDLQQALLAVVTPLPPEQSSPLLAAPGDAVGLGARPRTSSGQTNSAAELQLQLRRLELEAEKEKRAYELEAAERQKRLELAVEEKKLEAEEKITAHPELIRSRRVQCTVWSICHRLTADSPLVTGHKKDNIQDLSLIHI